MKITFVIGGARSGKSSFALHKASQVEGMKAFIATAEALDDDEADDGAGAEHDEVGAEKPDDEG